MRTPQPLFLNTAGVVSATQLRHSTDISAVGVLVGTLITISSVSKEFGHFNGDVKLCPSMKITDPD